MSEKKQELQESAPATLPAFAMDQITVPAPVDGCGLLSVSVSGGTNDATVVSKVDGGDPVLQPEEQLQGGGRYMPASRPDAAEGSVSEPIMQNISERQRKNNEKWEARFHRLVAYKKKHGHTRVPYPFQDEDGVKLGQWTAAQRLLFSNKKRGQPSSMSHYRFDRLHGINFELCKLEKKDDERWDAMFQRLKAFKEKHGHTRVPKDFQDEDGEKLGWWTERQRILFSCKKRRLPSSKSMPYNRFVQLKGINFVSVSETTMMTHNTEPEKKNNEKWDTMFQRLVAFKEEHGHTRVPASFQDEHDAKLGRWTNKQRTEFSKKKRKRPSPMPQHRFDRLKGINFEMSNQKNAIEARWGANSKARRGALIAAAPAAVAASLNGVGSNNSLPGSDHEGQRAASKSEVGGAPNLLIKTSTRVATKRAAEDDPGILGFASPCYEHTGTEAGRNGSNKRLKRAEEPDEVASQRGVSNAAQTKKAKTSSKSDKEIMAETINEGMRLYRAFQRASFNLENDQEFPPY